MTPANDGGFWRLLHDDLAAALARRLKGETLRVYLALADLTRGYSKERDVVSLSQIGQLAGVKRRDHVLRAIVDLTAKGLYGQTGGHGQDVIRWVVWPASGVPEAGNSSVPLAGNRTVPEAVPEAGTHQDTKKRKTGKKKSAADKPPPDSRVKTFLAFFAKTYAEAVGRPYIVAGAKDGAIVKRLLAALDGNCADALGELQQAARNMLADSWARQRADVGLLASKINSWRGKADTPKGRNGTFTPAPRASSGIYGNLGERIQ